MLLKFPGFNKIKHSNFLMYFGKQKRRLFKAAVSGYFINKMEGFISKFV